MGFTSRDKVINSRLWALNVYKHHQSKYWIINRDGLRNYKELELINYHTEPNIIEKIWKAQGWDCEVEHASRLKELFHHLTVYATITFKYRLKLCTIQKEYLRFRVQFTCNMTEHLLLLAPLPPCIPYNTLHGMTLSHPESGLLIFLLEPERVPLAD